MKKIILLLISLMTVLYSCSDNGTNPIQPEQLKNPHEMTWTVDTIYYSGALQTLMEHFSALTPKDIYLEGYSSSGPFGSLYHFDGNKWEDQRFGDLAIGILNNITKIEDESWGCGYTNDYSFIAKNDGKTWQRINIDNSNNLVTKGYLTSITGDSKTNIWTGGEKGIIIHFNGSNWVKDTINFKQTTGYNYGIWRMVIYQNNPFILGKMRGATDKTNGIEKYYHITGSENNWTVLDSMVIMPYTNNTWTFGEEGLYVGKSGRLFSFGSDVWLFNNNTWNKIYDTQEYISGMYELREDYMFVVGHYSHISFFDGTNWSRLTEIENKIPGVIYKDVWTNGEEVFIVGQLVNQFPMKSIVWHGK